MRPYFLLRLMTQDARLQKKVLARYDAAEFTREWFAWQNSLFGELIIYLVDSGKSDLLNSISVR